MTVAVAFLQPGWADWETGGVLVLLREYLKVQIEIATPTGDPETSIGGSWRPPTTGSTIRCSATPTSIS